MAVLLGELEISENIIWYEGMTFVFGASPTRKAGGWAAS
jgi:hypothetical protein